MTSRFTKITVALALFSASAAAWASNVCCGDIACCLQQMMDCCLH
ncbi:hypothetical protein EV672_103139 [Aquabacterium commune]|uniref:Uncharacterized protein n=1 Tax=Aquabacterium commune TaxID=70586 RepID=A0A4R6RED0_9BURK|nr:hypothetical protein [Aquabacterium commune]TDP84570.1 hypothetical protein EV672_103139 [Aquabacterium commune]